MTSSSGANPTSRLSSPWLSTTENPSTGSRETQKIRESGSLRMTPTPLHQLTRRHFFQDCRVGLGSMALASLLARDGRAAPRDVNPQAVQATHHPAQAKHVIF